MPSQLGPEEQELLARPREGKDDTKFRGKREDSIFERRQACVQYGWSIGLRAEHRRSGNRVEGKIASDEAGKVNGDQIVKGWTPCLKEVELYSECTCESLKFYAG